VPAAAAEQKHAIKERQTKLLATHVSSSSFASSNRSSTHHRQNQLLRLFNEIITTQTAIKHILTGTLSASCPMLATWVMCDMSLVCVTPVPDSSHPPGQGDDRAKLKQFDEVSFSNWLRTTTHNAGVYAQVTACWCHMARQLSTVHSVNHGPSALYTCPDQGSWMNVRALKYKTALCIQQSTVPCPFYVIICIHKVCSSKRRLQAVMRVVLLRLKPVPVLHDGHLNYYGVASVVRLRQDSPWGWPTLEIVYSLCAACCCHCRIR
jgi:hypothetical protein